MKIVCDTNVLVSGILFNGHPRIILKMASRGKVVNYTSPMLLRELEDVLLRPKFGLRPAEVSNILSLFRETFQIVHPGRRLRIITQDPDNDIVIETADAASAENIISGDRHLLALKKWRDSPILAPAEFMDAFPGMESEP